MHHCCTGKSPLSTLLCVLPSPCWPACNTTFALGLVAFSFSICSLLHAHCIQVLPFASCPLAITFCPWRCKHRCSCALNCGLYNPQLGCMPCVCQSINHCCACMQRESEPQLFMVSSFNIFPCQKNKLTITKLKKEKVTTYLTALVVQAVSQQRIAAFMAQTQPGIPAKLHRSSKTINITASARPAENGANATSSISHARSASTPVSPQIVHNHSC